MQENRIRDTFSKRLAQARESKKVKTSEIASALGMTPENYLRMEKGTQACSSERLAQISIFLNISTDELLGLRASSKMLSKKEELMLEMLRGLDSDYQSAIEQLVRTVYTKRPQVEFLKALTALMITDQKA